MGPELTLAWRYFHSTRKHPFINVIKKISILGVALGVAALIVVLAVMNGFETDLKSRIIGAFAHASVESGEPFEPAPELVSRIRQSSPHVMAVSPFVQAQALIEKGKRIEGVLVKGSTKENETSVTALAECITRGAYPLEGTREMMIGDVLASSLGLAIGDTVQFISPDKKKGETLAVSGIFHSGMYEYDSHLVYLPLDLAQELFALETKVTGIAVRYDDAERAIAGKRELSQAAGYPFYVMTWTDMNRNLFNALKLEKTVMFVILTLIVTVACFNIVGTLTLLVIDKTKDIGILKAVGFSSARIMNVFTWNGVLIGFWGTALGLAIGFLICALLERYSFIDIPSDIYYFGKLPVQTSLKDALVIGASSMGLSLLSTLYPAAAGANLKPVEALRYE